MNSPLVISLINNTALLLILSIIYEVSYYIPEKNKKIRPFVNGIMITAICIAIMLVPFKLTEGIVFDTRSILISVTGLIFGLIPTVVTAIAAVIFRVWMGGSGALPGTVVIVSSAVIGLVWRRLKIVDPSRRSWLGIYLMGLTVHAVMLAAMILLPSPQDIQVIKSIALPVMLIYPIGSVILGMLLTRQRDFREYQKQLSQSEKRYQALFNDAPLPYQSLDENGKIIEVNTQWLEMMGYESRADVIGTSYPEYLNEDGRKGFEERFSRFKENGTIVTEYTMLKKDGEGICVTVEGRINYEPDGSFRNTHCIIKDITEKKKSEEKLMFISNHDYLTGLFNRRYFEIELNKLDDNEFLPLSIVMGDINGLKLINDTLGHSYGDTLIIETAELLKMSIQEGNLLSRTGGDEFTILMPKTTAIEASAFILGVLEASRNYNLHAKEDVISINLSLGTATKEKPEQLMADVIRNAEYNMYQRKLLEKKSSHSSIISSMQATMVEKSHETEAHAMRLSNMAKKIGQVMSLPQHELDQLELLAMLHDIGKVAVPENILNKPGKLTQEEWSEMRKHPEIGYRIASSSPDLASIAEYILCHHERWDGKGYPQGIKGDDIPILSRILSVVDAFDAMTEDRAYRKAMDKNKAIDEIYANSGTQFDPAIASLFINKVLKEDEEKL